MTWPFRAVAVAGTAAFDRGGCVSGFGVFSTVDGTNASRLYRTMPEQLALPRSNAASIRTGDLITTGTISGPGRGYEGWLLELTRNGAEPLSRGHLAGGCAVG